MVSFVSTMSTDTHQATTPEVVIIKGSKKRMLLILLFSAVFAVLGFGLFSQKHDWFVGGGSMAFGLLGAVAAGLMMRPNSTFLRLDAAGIEIAVNRRSTRYAWHEIHAFVVGRISGAKMIGIQYSASYERQKAARKLAASLSGGMEGAISNVFEKSPEDLCLLLNEWKRRYQ